MLAQPASIKHASHLDTVTLRGRDFIPPRDSGVNWTGKTHRKVSNPHVAFVTVIDGCDSTQLFRTLLAKYNPK